MKAPALVAIVASLSALLLGYYLWGGVKELVMAALLPLGPVLAACATRADWPRRGWAMLSITAAAIIVVLGPGGALWAVPTLIPALILVVQRYGRSSAMRLVVPVAVLSVVLILPVLFTPTGPFDPLNSGIDEGAGLGNLIRPVNLLQVSGVWPSLDFRTEPGLDLIVKALAGVVIAIGIATVVYAARRLGEDGVPLVGYIGGAIVGTAVIMVFASAWVDAKVLATISPGVLAAALLGIVLIGQRTEFRLEAAVALAVVGGTVIWGAFLAYQGIWFAPRDHYTELEDVNRSFAGEGPALVTEVSGYGPRHFLSDLDPEGASDRRRRQVLLRTGMVPEDGVPVDLDEIRSDQLSPYNLFVLRRGPATSRPGADFGLAYSGDHYEVWRRRGAPGTLVQHLPLGNTLDAGAVPDCAKVGEMATSVGDEGSLVAARVGTPIAVEFEGATMPSGWTTPTAYTFSPSGSGQISTEIETPGGELELWLGGEIFGAVEIRIDGEPVASERAVLNNTAGMEELTTVALSRGAHKLEVEYKGASLWPGSAVRPYAVGPLEFRSPQGSDLGLFSVAPSEYRRLCGTRWDWIEAYAPATF
jgi:hypothetical protein